MVKPNGDRQEFQLSLSCQSAHISEVIQDIKTRIRRCHQNVPDLEFRLEMAVREMLANAIRHGCSERAGKVEITCSVDDAGVKVRVADPGPGFAWRERDLTMEISLEEEGRGLKMINQAADKIEFNGQGSIITAYFYNQTEEEN